MREAHKRSQEYLMTSKPEAGEDKRKEDFKRHLLEVVGFSEEEIKKRDVNKMSNVELQNLMRQRLLGVMTNNGSRQRAIPESEVAQYIAMGWEYINSINGEKAIVKMPF